MPTNVYAPNKGNLIEPPYSSFPDNWDAPVNSNFGMISALTGGLTEIDASTFTSTVPYKTLVFKTYEEDPEPWTVALAGQNLCIRLYGALSTNAILYIPKTVKGMWLIDNQTTGNYTLTIKTSAGSSTGIAIPQLCISNIYSDGTNVTWADKGSVVSNVQKAIYPGTMFPYAGITVPPGYLGCDGAAYSRTTYSDLFTAIGTSWGAGDGSTTFNVPNFENYFMRGASASAPVGTVESDDFKSHTHAVTLTDPGHTHTIPMKAQFSAIGASGGAVEGTQSTTTSSSTTGLTVVNANTGGTETRPQNKRVLFIIKY